MIHRAGLIGDVHGQLPALRAALAFLKTQPGLDVLLCTGDLPERNSDSLTDIAVQCAKILDEEGVLTVRGNHDRWKLSDLGADDPGFVFLASLPTTRDFSTPLGPAMLCHGLGRDDMNGLGRDDMNGLGRDDMNGLYRDTHGHDRIRHQIGLAKLMAFESIYPHRLLIAGHTHQRMVARFGEVTVLNAGALEVKTDPPTVGIVDFDRREARFFDIDPTSGAVTEAEIYALSRD